MIIGICAFTSKGWELADQIITAFPEHIFEKREKENALTQWAKHCFHLRSPMIFIGACGIAVRSIAPFVADKLEDPPVLVIDDKGQHVIPLLSGHMGGANELALQLSRRMQHATNRYPLQPVLTTATDVGAIFSVDVFARRNGFAIVNREGIQKVSSALLQRETLTLGISPSITYDKEDIPSFFTLEEDPLKGVDLWITDQQSSSVTATLTLLAKELVLGIGCKKGTACEDIRKIIEHQSIDLTHVSAVASIDLKEKEYGLVAFCQKRHLPFHTYSAGDLQEVNGEFKTSEFVARVTGVGNICERAAAKEAGNGYQLILPKTAKDGITLAVAKRKVVIKSWETSSIS